MTVLVDKRATSTQTRRMDHERCNSHLFHIWNSIGSDVVARGVEFKPPWFHMRIFHVMTCNSPCLKEIAIFWPKIANFEKKNVDVPRYPPLAAAEFKKHQTLATDICMSIVVGY